MDRFVTRAPTWKTLEMSSFTRSFANVSFTGKKSTPKDKAPAPINKRLSIRDEKLLKIFTSQADEPLIAKEFTPQLNGSFGGGIREKPSLGLTPGDENTPPPNARNTTFRDDHLVDVMCSGESRSQSNSRPSTPIASSNNNYNMNLDPCTPKDNPFLARIQRDLNSPSAAARVRAMKALRSPTKSAYTNFDIPHEEQDIITEEERKSPVKVKSIQELMKDVVVYVEVRTGEDNRSSGVKKVISALGAKVNDKLLRDTTHVVFKDGLLSTYNKAKKWNIPIVSILWIEACKKQMRLMSPKDFPISNADRYENPELYDKMKRYKSMQPDAEDNRRQRAKVPTKENGLKTKMVPATSTNSNSTKKKTDITRFFTQLEKVKSTPSNSSVAASPSTQMLQRINENFCTPQSSDDSLKKLAYLDSISLSESIVQTPASDAKKTLDFESESRTASTSKQKTPTRRRNSIQITQTPQTDGSNLASNDSSISATPGVRTRRRSSIHIPTNMCITGKEDNQSSTKPFATISEEIPEDPDPEVEAETEAEKRQTTFSQKSVDITKSTPLAKHHSTRRRTLYTPKPMEESKPQSNASTSSAVKRRTLFTKTSDLHTMEMSSIAPITPISGGIPSSTLIGEDSVKTPVQFASLLEEHASATIFSSTKTPSNSRRRTLFDVSMDIISQRLQNINQSAKSVRTTRPEDRRSSQDDPDTIAALLTPTDNNKTIRKELFNGNDDSAQKKLPIPSTPLQSTAATPVEALTKKKRKLFVPNDILLTPTPLTEEDPAVIPKRIHTPDTPSASKPATTKRRKTIMPTLTQSKTEQKKAPPRNNGATVTARSSRRSTMDFEAIKKAKSVIEKSTNPTQDATKPKPYPFLVYTNMHKEQIEFVKEAITKLQGFQLEDKVSDNTTHIVSLEPRRTFNLLRGLVRGLWILNYNWIVDSVKAGHWLNEEEYELRNFSRAVEICRSERQAFGNGYKMDIFIDLGPIYISSKCNIPKESLKELITLCAGRIVDRRKRAKYIIGGDSSPEILPDKIYLDPQWILDSISNNQLQKLTKYFINNATTDEK